MVNCLLKLRRVVMPAAGFELAIFIMNVRRSISTEGRIHRVLPAPLLLGSMRQKQLISHTRFLPTNIGYCRSFTLFEVVKI